MPSFTTINKVDNQGRIVKYDNYPTEEEARARIVELHAMGITDAFYVDDDATAVNGERCFQTCRHWIADPVAKTVTLDRASLAAEIRAGHMAVLRAGRNRCLEASDAHVFPDRWQAMATETQDQWTKYRQALRDLPATAADPAAPVWPTEPAP